MKKMSQVERLSTAESLLDEVYREIYSGEVHNKREAAQLAVNCQALSNKLVFAFNEMNRKRKTIYICDCQVPDCKKTGCQKECFHTLDVNHAKNGPVVNWREYYDRFMKFGDCFVEKMSDDN